MFSKYAKKRPYLVALLWVMLAGAGVPQALASPQSDYEEADVQAQEAVQAYDEAFKAREEAVKEVARVESKVSENQVAVDKARRNAEDVAVSMYKNADRHVLWEMILTSDNLADVLESIDSYVRIAAWQHDSLIRLKNAQDELEQSLEDIQKTRSEAEKALSQAENAKVEANERRDAAREAYEEAQREAEAAAASAAMNASSANPHPSSSGAYAQTSSSWNDEQSAKEYIIYRESRGNYSATNGRYYGAYQLDSSYLDGDYSPEHQDEVAESYVQGRYGSWSAAAEFWDAHSWY